LRGAVPIILATFPLLANLPQAEMIFDIVFFIVLTSVLFQGTSVSSVSKVLSVHEPARTRRTYPIEFEPTDEMNASLEELIVPFGSHVIKKPLYAIGLPPGSLIVLICRDEKFFIPQGTTVLEQGDVLLVLGNREDINSLQSLLTRPNAPDEEISV
jgi:cell volume regulation protein A